MYQTPCPVKPNATQRRPPYQINVTTHSTTPLHRACNKKWTKSKNRKQTRKINQKITQKIDQKPNPKTTQKTNHCEKQKQRHNSNNGSPTSRLGPWLERSPVGGAQGGWRDPFRGHPSRCPRRRRHPRPHRPCPEPPRRHRFRCRPLGRSLQPRRCPWPWRWSRRPCQSHRSCRWH